MPDFLEFLLVKSSSFLQYIIPGGIRNIKQEKVVFVKAVFQLFAT